MPVIFEFACANICVLANTNINSERRRVQLLRLVLTCIWLSYSEVILPCDGSLGTCDLASPCRKFGLYDRTLSTDRILLQAAAFLDSASAFVSKLLPTFANNK